MLIITRKPGEGLVFKTPLGSIRLKWLDRNRLAIDAPASIPVVREELDSDN